MSEKSLEGQVAIVTGSARGIGRSIAMALAERGADVVISDIDEEQTKKTSEEINALGRRSLGIACDVSQRDQVFGLVEKAVAELGQLDIFVNNAGITRDTLMLRMTEDQWQSVIDINLKGTFFGCQAASKVMMMARKGSIVNIASVVALGGNAGQANYTASKAGVLALTRTIAIELGSRKVRVNAVAPGFIETDMTKNLPDKVREELTKQIPLKRTGTPEDVSKAVCYLCSPESDYITGQCIVVDGGLTLG
ncbi:MAG: 3-oxoacyl-[acyl-carrier-protein] reductase [Planctomycetota bacterium]|jgi:3-oxoacyl-[acyl-carrier protein] reductase